MPPSEQIPPLPPPHLTEWCQGLSLVEHRALTSEDRAQLQSEQEQYRLRLCVTGCSSPFILLGAVLFLIFASSAVTTAAPWTVAIVIVLDLVPLYLLCSKASHHYECSKGLRGDLAAGYVKKFAGVEEFVDMELLEAEMEAEARGEQIDASESGPLRHREIYIEVLPFSGRLWKTNGVAEDKWQTVEWATVATTPESAERAAAWVTPINPFEDNIIEGLGLSPSQINRRELSPEELVELRRTIRGLWPASFWATLLLSGWHVINILLDRAAGTPTTLGPLPIFLLFLCACSWYFLIRAIINVIRLKRDLASRHVDIIKAPRQVFAKERTDVSPLQDAGDTGLPESDNPTSPGSDVTTEVLLVYSTYEILPESGCTWTEDWQTTEWRTITY
jgi:hypothetical protein